MEFICDKVTTSKAHGYRRFIGFVGAGARVDACTVCGVAIRHDTGEVVNGKMLSFLGDKDNDRPRRIPAVNEPPARIVEVVNAL